ncbi:MAG: hypothetical protein J7L20_04700 [Thermoplasmata archaeon]|nr:hypothetical protein [Thermoplasmata archaeon]
MKGVEDNMRLKFFGLTFSLILLLTVANPVVASQREENLIKISNALQQEREQPRLIKLINWSYIKCMLECIIKDPESKDLLGIFRVYFIGCILSLWVSLCGFLTVLRYPIYSLILILAGLVGFAVCGWLAASFLWWAIDHCNEKCREGECPVC